MTAGTGSKPGSGQATQHVVRLRWRWTSPRRRGSGLSWRRPVRRGLVHYHFDSKADLVTSILDYLLDRLTADINAAPLSEPEAALRSVLERVGYGPTDGDPDAYYRALFALRSQASFDPAIRERLARTFHLLVERLSSIVAAGIEDGTFVDLAPDATATFLHVAIDGARTTELSLATGKTREQVLDILETLFFPQLLVES